MASRTEFRVSPPQQVYDAYMEIRESSLILNKMVTEANIAEFQNNLNKAQPSNDDESKARSLFQYLYRKHPTNFCRFLVRSRLSHMILWTDAKCIVRHFGLIGIVYIKWNDIEYECSMHRNMNNNSAITDEHPSAQKTYKSIGADLEIYFNDNQINRRPREYNREHNGRGDGKRQPREYNRERSWRGDGELQPREYNREHNGGGDGERRPREYNREPTGGRYQRDGNRGGNNVRSQNRPNTPTNNNDNFPVLKNTYDHISESVDNTLENNVEITDLTNNTSVSILDVLLESQTSTPSTHTSTHSIHNDVSTQISYTNVTTPISYSRVVKGETK